MNTIWQMLGKVVMVGVGLVTTGLLTRNLGPGAYGGYTLIVSSFIILDAIADFGTKIIGVREMSAENDREKRSVLLGQLVWLRILTGAMAYAVGLLVVFGWQVFEPVRLEALLALTMLWLTLFGGVWEIVYQVEMRMDLKVVRDLVYPLLIVVGVVYEGGEITLIKIFLISIVAKLVSVIFGWKTLVKLFDWKKITAKIDWKIVKNIWNLSWPMGAYLLLFASYDRGVDSMMISRFVGLREVAWYGLAYKIYTTLLQPAYFFVTATFPLMAAKEVEKKKLFKWSLLLLMLGVVGLIVGTQIMAPWAIGLLGGTEYQPAVTALRILILASFFSYLSHLFGFTLIARGGQKEMLKLGVVNLSFNLVANYFLIQRYGINCAAWVTVATEMLGTVGMGYLLFKITNNQVPRNKRVPITKSQ